MWSFSDGRWWRIDGARKESLSFDGKKTRPAVTEDDLRRWLPERLAFARQHNPCAHLVVTSTNEPPTWHPGSLPGEVIVLG